MSGPYQRLTPSILQYVVFQEWLDNEALCFIEGPDGLLVCCHMDDVQELEVTLNAGHPVPPHPPRNPMTESYRFSFSATDHDFSATESFPILRRCLAEAGIIGPGDQALYDDIEPDDHFDDIDFHDGEFVFDGRIGAGSDLEQQFITFAELYSKSFPLFIFKVVRCGDGGRIAESIQGGEWVGNIEHTSF